MKMNIKQQFAKATEELFSSLYADKSGKFITKNFNEKIQCSIMI